MRKYRVYFRLSTECYVDIEATDPEVAEAIVRFNFSKLNEDKLIEKGSQGINNIMATYLKEDK